MYATRSQHVCAGKYEGEYLTLYYISNYQQISVFSSFASTGRSMKWNLDGTNCTSNCWVACIILGIPVCSIVFSVRLLYRFVCCSSTLFGSFSQLSNQSSGDFQLVRNASYAVIHLSSFVHASMHPLIDMISALFDLCVRISTVVRVLYITILYFRHLLSAGVFYPSLCTEVYFASRILFFSVWLNKARGPHNSSEIPLGCF